MLEIGNCVQQLASVLNQSTGCQPARVDIIWHCELQHHLQNGCRKKQYTNNIQYTTKKTHLYITSNISATNFFKFSSNVVIRLFFARSRGSGYSTILRGASKKRSSTEKKNENTNKEKHLLLLFFGNEEVQWGKNTPKTNYIRTSIFCQKILSDDTQYLQTTQCSNLLFVSLQQKHLA